MRTYEATIESAREAAAAGELRAWTQSFLASDGSDNAELAGILDDEMAHWLGPVRLPFDELNRLAGPPDQPTLGRLDEDDLETVEDMQESIDEGWEPAPLVASYRDDHLVLEDGNHRIEGLRREGHTDYWTVVCCRTERQRDEFLARYGES